jgi:hypothetical protein
MIELPVSWMLTVIGGLAGVIATLAGIIWHSLNARLAAQDKIIEHLKADVDRMAKGCGMDGCHWKRR